MCIYNFVLDLKVKIWVMIHLKYNIISLIPIPHNFYQEKQGLCPNWLLVLLGKMDTSVFFHSQQILGKEILLLNLILCWEKWIDVFKIFMYKKMLLLRFNFWSICMVKNLQIIAWSFKVLYIFLPCKHTMYPLQAFCWSRVYCPCDIILPLTVVNSFY